MTDSTHQQRSRLIKLYRGPVPLCVVPSSSVSLLPDWPSVRPSSRHIECVRNRMSHYLSLSRSSSRLKSLLTYLTPKSGKIKFQKRQIIRPLLTFFRREGGNLAESRPQCLGLCAALQYGFINTDCNVSPH